MARAPQLMAVPQPPPHHAHAARELRFGRVGHIEDDEPLIGDDAAAVRGWDDAIRVDEPPAGGHAADIGQPAACGSRERTGREGG